MEFQEVLLWGLWIKNGKTPEFPQPPVQKSQHGKNHAQGPHPQAPHLPSASPLWKHPQHFLKMNKFSADFITLKDDDSRVWLLQI